jgi:hypothetical protein
MSCQLYLSPTVAPISPSGSTGPLSYRTGGAFKLVEYCCNGLIADLVADARKTKELKKLEIILKDFSYEAWTEGWVDVDLTRLGMIVKPLAPYPDQFKVELLTQWHHSVEDEVRSSSRGEW